MPIAVSSIVPVIAAQAATNDVPLQPGTVVDAQVLKLLENNLVRIAIASLTIEAFSQVPLQVGQSLQLAVSQTANGVQLAIVGQGPPGEAATASPAALANSPQDTVTLAPDAAAIQVAGASTDAMPARSLLSPAEALAVTVATQAAAARQDSLAPLFANLGIAAASDALPPKLQQAIAQVLAQRTGFDSALTGSDIQAAFKGSGLFLEASLANQTASAAASSATPSAEFPDLKAALIVFRQTLSVWLGDSAAATPATAGTSTAPSASPATTPSTVQTPLQATASAVPDPAGNAAPAVQIANVPTLVPSLTPEAGIANAAADDISTPSSASQIFPPSAKMTFDSAALLNLLSPSDAAASMASRADGAAVARTNTPPPPFAGALPSAQPVAMPSLSPNAPAAEVARHLIGDADAAIARQTLLQVASLPDRIDPSSVRQDPTTPRWNFEIPFATPQGTAVAQFEIARDGGGNEVEAAKQVWRARFSLDVEPAGPVHALISLSGDKTSVRMWAERPATAARLRADSSQLTQALHQAQLRPGDIVIQSGAPIQQATAPAGHFLDRAS